MVSPNSSTEEASSESMEDNEKRFYNVTANTHRALGSTSSEYESESESDNGNLPQKKPQPTPPNRNVVKPSSSTKRPREEEQTKVVEKNKKAKEVKKAPPLETPKQTDKKSSEEKKRVKKSDSEPKSAKKNGQVWNTQDEISFLKAFVGYKTSKGLPKTNMSPVYDYIRSLKLLDHEYTNIQMYDKFRRLKVKFNVLNDKVNNDDFTFKTAHEESFYKLGRKIWISGEGEEEENTDEEEGDEEDGKKTKEKGDEEDGKKSKEKVVEMENKENEEEEEEEDEDEDREGNSASNGVQKQSKPSNSKEKENPKPSSVSDIALNNGSTSTRGVGKVIDLLRKENLVLMKEMKDYVGKELVEYKREIKEMVREVLQSTANSGNGDFVQFSSEEMKKSICSARELPKLDKAEADRLEQKWKKQHLIELDASSKHLQLLQEECQLRMDKLRSQVED